MRITKSLIIEDLEVLEFEDATFEELVGKIFLDARRDAPYKIYQLLHLVGRGPDGYHTRVLYSYRLDSPLLLTHYLEFTSSKKATHRPLFLLKDPLVALAWCL